MLSIGAFAKRVGLSVKAVRLYQEKRLLHPARVDAFTGYRYFDEACVERARLIVRLRGFELSLSEIREVLEEPDASAGLVACLERQRARIEARIARYNQTIRQLDDSLGETLMTQKKFKISSDADARLEGWLARLDSDAHQSLKGPLANITVSSLCGVAGGEALAAALAHRVAFDAWDEPLIEALASTPASRARILGTLDDEQRRWCDGQKQRVKPAQLSPTLEVALAIAAHGGSIFVELGMNFLLTPVSSESDDARLDALRLRLIPTLDALIPHHAGRVGVDEEVARRLLEAAGAEREAFVQRVYGASLDDQDSNDIIFNSQTLSVYNVVELCTRAYESKFMPEPGWAFVGRI